MYLLLIVTIICLVGICIKDITYVHYLHNCIDDLETTNKNLRESNKILKELANEQSRL